MVNECTFLFTGGWAYNWGGGLYVGGRGVRVRVRLGGLVILFTGRWAYKWRAYKWGGG